MSSIEKQYFELLGKEFPTKEAIITELINLEAIMNLPKGTELFLSDLHGEYTAFDHILRTGAGNVKEKIYNLFSDELTNEEKDKLGVLIAYPEMVLADPEFYPNKDISWYKQMIRRLVRLLDFAATKYTRSKVRKTLPDQFGYVIEELLYTDTTYADNKAYYQQVLDHLIYLKQGDEFIAALSFTIRKLTVDHLHIVGDIFDRGPDADKVMDRLCTHHSVDIQWGNHDILWIGAFAGSKACLVTLLRIATRYNYLFEIEKAYGLNLRPLFMFAEKTYKKNPEFTLKDSDNDSTYMVENLETMGKVHQALAILQFKLEEQLLERRLEFDMDNRKMLEKIDFKHSTITLGDKKFLLENTCFQTIDENNVSELTDEEDYVVETLLSSFQQSPRMKKHVDFLLKKGSMYLVYNNHLLFHGCIPLDKVGNFLPLKINGKSYKGKKLLEFFDLKVREACLNKDINDDLTTDLIWYCWSGKVSPQFGKNAMTTFERYFISDKKAHKEIKNYYYSFRDTKETCAMILDEFGLNSTNSKIINGHTPVKVTAGESPIKGNGRLFVIDGGMSKAYHGTTGIAGYSLLNNSYGFQLVTHEPFYSAEKLLETKKDKTVLKKVIDKEMNRTLIRETTVGKKIAEQIENLHELLNSLDN